MARKKTANEVILSKLQRPEKAVTGDLKTFNNFFEKERDINTRSRISKKGKLFLETTGDFVEYESLLEKRILKLLDEDEHIIGIKTQSLYLEYYYWGKDRFYYPDIIFLSANGHIGVIEVKDSISMFKAKTYKKYEALEKYCEEQGYFYAMLNDMDDVETLRNNEVKINLEKYLNKIFETKKSISWASIKETCKLNDWKINDVLTIVHKNGWKVKSPKSRVWAFSISK